MKRLFGHGEHLVRVVVLFAAGLLLFLAVKGALVPEGFGAYGHYRAGALQDNRAQPVSFAGRAACAECHDAEPAALAGGRHAAIGCEGCHGALAVHAGDPERKPRRPQSPALCLRCHQRAGGRPAAFPQVDVAEHSGETSCTDCHSPHDPGRQP